MNRRNFLKSSTAAALAPYVPFGIASTQGWRTFETVTRVEIRDSFGIARAWVPLPLVGENEWQKTFGNSWSGNASRADVMHDGKYGLAMLYVEWPEKEMNPAIEITSRFMTRDRAVDFGAANSPKTNVGGEHPAIDTSDNGDHDPLVVGLRKLGHQVDLADQSSGLSAIVRDNAGWVGGADPRREGLVMGDTR